MILNQQRRVRVAVPTLGKFLARAQRRLHLHADELTVCLVTKGKIARWNRAYRGKKGPTDVLSFPTNGSRARKSSRKSSGRPREGLRSGSVPSSNSYLGDIAISPAVARVNASRFGRTFDEEMRILVLHGILHLMGYDHETDSGQMNRREQRLRRDLGLA
jgi:probable rRNA maturation factor